MRPVGDAGEEPIVAAHAEATPIATTRSRGRQRTTRRPYQIPEQMIENGSLAALG